MSAAILHQRHNPIGISRRSEQPRGVLAAIIANAASTTPMQNRLELVTRSGPTAYNLASTDDLAEQSNCEGSKRSYSGGNFFRFANACLASADRRLSRSYSLRFRLDSVPASGAEPTARSEGTTLRPVCPTGRKRPRRGEHYRSERGLTDYRYRPIVNRPIAD